MTPGNLLAGMSARATLSGHADGQGSLILCYLITSGIWRFHALCRFLAFDRHFNLVLADTEEYRKLPPKKGKSEAEVTQKSSSADLEAMWRYACPLQLPIHIFCNRSHSPSSRKLMTRQRAVQREERRVLGLLLLRGDEIVSLTIEGPPPTEELRAQKGQVAPVRPPPSS